MLCLCHEILVKLDCYKDFNVGKYKCSFFFFFFFLDMHLLEKKKTLFLFFNCQGTVTNVCVFTCMLNVH